MRAIVAVSGGTATGERISGEVVGPRRTGWCSARTVTPPSTSDCESARPTAVIYVSYIGVLELNDAISAAVGGGGGTTAGGQYFRTGPLTECGRGRAG